MQKILDHTQESLAQAFASLARNAKRQQHMYLATIGSLMLTVLISALLLAVFAAVRQLDYRRTSASRSATDISLLLHRAESLLRRAQFTLDYYYGTSDAQRVADAIQQSIRQTGRVRAQVGSADSAFDLIVGDTTHDAWGSQAGEKLWRLYESAESTLVTQQAFRLHQHAMLVGLNEDYAAIMPALAQSATHKTGAAAAALPDTPAAQSAVVSALRETLERELQTQTGRRLPGKGEQLWLGPYSDPLRGVPVISVVSAYYAGDTPSALISVSIPLDALTARLMSSADSAVMVLTRPDHRLIASAPPVDALTAATLRNVIAHGPSDTDQSVRKGAIFRLLTMPGFGVLVGYVPWSVLLASLAWQLGVLGCVTVLILLAIALSARFWGLRLLRNAFTETSRALESGNINHMLFSATPVGLCVVRQSDYSILMANARAAAFLGVEVRGAALPAHIADELRVQTPARVASKNFAGIASFVVPVSAPCTSPQENDGDVVHFLQLTYAPAHYASDDVLFCAILDVTAQQALEQQLRLAQQTSETMMRARSNFFASISHEIRTPLNALLGNLELLARTPGLHAHQQRLATLGVAADALRRVVNDILDFSKIDAGELKLVHESFRPLDDFENLALSYAPMATERSVRFYSYLSPTLDQEFCGDRTRIAQIVNNLLCNAFKFTSWGKITLHAEVLDDSRGQSVLHCRVCDSGVGMDEALLARIFNPFVQGEAGASNRIGGTGLGLSICARLCELMGGRIAVDSVPRVGSAFSVSIPLARLITQQSNQSQQSQQLAAEVARRGVVLTVCQERESGEALGEWLRRAGWVAHVATSLNSAQAWLRANRPDAMLVSGEYGLDAIEVLRDVRPVGTVWTTRTGPHRAAWRADGMLETTEFSRAAILSAVELAAELADESAVELADERTLLRARPIDTIEPLPDGSVTPPPPSALRGLTVLVAEDNPLIQTLIAEQLTTLGCVPTIAADGRQALVAFQQTHFDVVLTDIHMPVMSGYTLLAALRESDADLPVLMLSAESDAREDTAWRGRGFTGYVAKPASMSELEAALLAVVSAPLYATGKVVPSRAGSAPDIAGEAQSRDTIDTPRHTAMLKVHFEADACKLMTLIEKNDPRSLREWAHSASGALMVVQARRLAARCRTLQRLCDSSEGWTTAMNDQAMSLHKALSDHFKLNDPSRS